jgi:hypothetical protein
VDKTRFYGNLSDFSAIYKLLSATELVEDLKNPIFSSYNGADQGVARDGG